MNTRCLLVVLLLPLASCAVGAGATIGVHYTTEHSFRVQIELPLEADLVGAGSTEVERATPYMRAAVVPQLYYDTKAGALDGGVHAALGPVFRARDRWLGPAFTIGGSGFGRKFGLDVGVNMDLETPFSNGAECDDLRFNNLLAPQISVTRHVIDVDHPLASAGGFWTVGIAVGIRHTRVLSCGGGQTQPPQRVAEPSDAADG